MGKQCANTDLPPVNNIFHEVWLSGNETDVYTATYDSPFQDYSHLNGHTG